MSALKDTGSTYRWRQLRARVLDEEPVCRWQMQGCTTVATEADHITARKHGGTDARENLCGSCQPCNLKRAAQMQAADRSGPSRRW